MANPILFAHQNRIIKTASGLKTSIFHAKSICTILSITLQLSADDTLQLLDAEGAPISSAFTLAAGVIWCPPGRLLANNDRIFLSIAGSASVTYQIVWQSGNCLEKIRDHRDYFYIPDPGLDASSTTASAPAATTITAASTVVLPANSLRKEVMIQNTGTTAVYLALGHVATDTVYHIALSACTVANDGTGGVYVSDLWKGAIQAIAAVGGTIVITELT